MDPRYLQESGLQVYTGNELVLKGALEAGVALMTGYPGSPFADFFELGAQVKDLLAERGIVFQMANNEALSAARVNGAQMSDLRAMAVMKSVGVHVASDGLALGNLTKQGQRGGAVIVMGDDPWSDTTQVPADSRFIAQHLFLPVLEPSTYQELKDWVRYAFELSAYANIYIGYLVTTPLADGGGSVQVYPNRYPTVNTKAPVTLVTADIPVEQTVLLPPRTTEQEERIDERFSRLIQRVRQFGLNDVRWSGRGHSPLGFVASGFAYSYLEHALREMGLAGQVPILKLGLTYPLDRELLHQVSQQVDELIVVEEKRPLLETQIRGLIAEWHQLGQLKRLIPVWGKQLPPPYTGLPVTSGLNPSILIERLGPFLRERLPHLPPTGLAAALERIAETAAVTVSLPQRTPTFCPGCPHRDSSNVLLDVQRDFRDAQYMRRRHHRGPVDLVFHGDTGCYTMLMFKPNGSLMHNYSGMGLGGATGAGIDPFITNKQIVFMGDGTFFHSGMVAISDSLKHGQDITYIILDNKTTAMTGHQPTAGCDTDVIGNPTFAQDIEAILRGMTHRPRVMARGRCTPILRVNPAYRDTYRRVLEETIVQDGVKVIIADKECGITFHRRQRSEQNRLTRLVGYVPEERHINITHEVCEYCLECTKATGCPGLTITETMYGPKIATDRSTCVADKACTKRLVCPSFEEVIVTRRKPPRPRRSVLDGLTMPQPERAVVAESWSAYVAGVGGMGIGVITAVLVQAGLREGYQVQFYDKKGLAIRNGGVYSFILYAAPGVSSLSPVIPYGNVDVLLGLDCLEAARGIDPAARFRVASRQRTAAVLNTAKTPTIGTLMGEETFDPETLARAIRNCTDASRYFGSNLSELCERHLGSKLYSNLMLVGVAYQLGWLPLHYDVLEWAIRASVKRDEMAKNLEAFQLGRALVAAPERFHSGDAPATLQMLVDEKAGYLRQRRFSGPALAKMYRALVREAVEPLALAEPAKIHYALRMYDMFQFDGAAYARRYAEAVQRIYARDRAEFEWQATVAAIHNLHRVMVIKDEVYVAHLLTSQEKLARDRQRYGVDAANGDRLRYVHLNQPEFTVFGRTIRFRMNTRHWQLALMRHAKFLRRWLPQWHRREQVFRDWYLALAGQFAYTDAASYRRYVEALNVPSDVTGYREIRYPKMDRAMARAEALLHLPVTGFTEPAKVIATSR